MRGNIFRACCDNCFHINKLALLLLSSHQPSSLSLLLTSLSVFIGSCIHGSWLCKSLAKLSVTAGSRLWTLSLGKRCHYMCACVFAGVEHNDAIKVTYLSLLAWGLYYTGCSMRISLTSSIPTPKTINLFLQQQVYVSTKRRVLMFAEVKVICQTGETAGWLRRGNW